jgi:hypothetical protein
MALRTRLDVPVTSATAKARVVMLSLTIPWFGDDQRLRSDEKNNTNHGSSKGYMLGTLWDHERQWLRVHNLISIIIYIAKKYSINLRQPRVRPMPNPTRY